MFFFSVKDEFKWKVITSGKSLPEYPVNAGVSRSSILGPRLLLLYINNLSKILSCMLSTFFSKCDQASDL